MLLCFSLVCLTLLQPGTACPAHEVALPCQVPRSGLPWVLREDCLLGGTEAVSIKSRSITVPPGRWVLSGNVFFNACLSNMASLKITLKDEVLVDKNSYNATLDFQLPCLMARG